MYINLTIRATPSNWVSLQTRMSRTAMSRKLALGTLHALALCLAGTGAAWAAKTTFGIRLEIRSPARVQVGATDPGPSSAAAAAPPSAHAMALARIGGRVVRVALPAHDAGTAEVVPLPTAAGGPAGPGAAAVTILLQ